MSTTTTTTTTTPRYDLYIATADREDNHPDHWVLVLTRMFQDLSSCTIYHAGCCPRDNYYRAVEEDEDAPSWGVRQKWFIGILEQSGREVLEEAAKTVEIQDCQRYILRIVEILENKEFVPLGSRARHASRLDGEQDWAYDNHAYWFGEEAAREKFSQIR
ncbi:hypothetical protein BJX61DRAFT_540222 [Aspergillus egyptiacus]|nr:hypothetical protein BJX61DRAFT_540222 [Aspergillus egyptiacus]